jgi:hypothetical protein
LDALEKYRESVEAKNLNTTYEVPPKIDYATDWSIARAKSRCLKQECLSGQQLLQKIRLDQEGRDKLLKLKLELSDRKRKWSEFDIKTSSSKSLITVCLCNIF